MSRTREELRFQISWVNMTLKLLRSSEYAIGSAYYRGYKKRNPDLSVSDYARLIEAQIDERTELLHGLQAEMRELNKGEPQPDPVSVPLKPAKLVNKVLR